MGRRSSLRELVTVARRLFPVEGFVPGDRRPSEPCFDDVVVFYNRVFDLGGYINPTQGARKLLHEDFALAAPNYLTNEIEIATRFQEIVRLRANAQDLIAFHQRLEADGVRGVMKWSLREPFRVWRLVWQHIRAYRSSPSEEQLSDENTEDAQRNGARSESIQDTLEDTMNFVNDSMSRLGLMESLLRHVDRKLFNPQYLAEVPFTRISLQSFDATLLGEGIGVDVSLLIHRTGVGILTFYATFHGMKSAKQLLEIELIGSKPEISKLRIARSIVEPQWRSYGGSTSQLDQSRFEREFSSGIEWLTDRSEEKSSLADIFDLYETAVVSSLRGKQPSSPSEPWSWRRTPEWLIYPVVFARRVIPDIPDGATFRRLYPKVIAGLVQRVPWQRLTEENS